MTHCKSISPITTKDDDVSLLDLISFFTFFGIGSCKTQICAVIQGMEIKNQKDVIIDKNIARIFRADNLLEYKSLSDF